MKITLKKLIDLQEDLDTAIHFWGEDEITENLRKVINIAELIHQDKHDELNKFMNKLPKYWDSDLNDVAIGLLDLHRDDRNYDSVLESVDIVEAISKLYVQIKN